MLDTQNASKSGVEAKNREKESLSEGGGEAR
jgi:hypothetical protein